MLGSIGERARMQPPPRASYPSSWLGRNLEQVELLGQQLRRRMLVTFPFSHFRGRDYLSRLAELPEVSRGADRVEQNILTELRGSGAAFLLRQDLTPLLGLGGGELIHSLAESVRAGFFARQKQFLGSEGTLAAFPGAWRLGLQSRMLDLAEGYLGLPCFYLGATVKRAVPSRPAMASNSEAIGQAKASNSEAIGQAKASDSEAVGQIKASSSGAIGHIKSPRAWHLDMEDERVVRVLVYLSPVSAGDGPFEFLPRLVSQSVEMSARYRAGQIGDNRMKKLAARATRRVAYGETGDAVIFDGAQIFHRNRPPLTGERYSITFAYCSRKPLQIDPRRKLSEGARERLAITLSARQQGCLPPKRF